jgi:hypothetical protein
MGHSLSLSLSWNPNPSPKDGLLDGFFLFFSGKLLAKRKKKKMGRIIYAIERGVWLPYGFPLSSGSF